MGLATWAFTLQWHWGRSETRAVKSSRTDVEGRLGGMGLMDNSPQRTDDLLQRPGATAISAASGACDDGAMAVSSESCVPCRTCRERQPRFAIYTVCFHCIYTVLSY